MERIKGKSFFRKSWAIYLFLSLAVIGVWPTLLRLFERWQKFDEAYSHGFLVMLISLYLCFGTWKRVRPESGVYWPWLFLLVVATLIYLAGQFLLVEAFQQVALIPIFFSGLLVFWGWRQALPFLIPMGLLAFTLPFWDYLSLPLQLITVAANQFMLSWLDIEFVVEGVFVYFPGVGAFEIAHGCSGLRYLLVGITLSLLYGELNLRKWSSRIQLVLLGVIFSLLANWIRVFIIIYVGYESNMTSSLIKEHDFFGWWVFAATLVPLFFLARWLELREAGLIDKDMETNLVAQGCKASGLKQLVVCVPVLVLVAATYFSGPSAVGKWNSGKSSKSIPALVDSSRWMPLFTQELSGWSPDIKGADRYVEESYVRKDELRADGASEEVVFIGLYTYDYQRPGAEAVQYHNRFYDASIQLPDRTFEVDTGGGIELSGLTLKYRQSSEHIHVAYGYYIEGRWERFDLQAKLAQLPGVFNRRSDASILVIGLQCATCDAERTLGTIASEIRPSAQDYLDGFYLAN